MCGLLGSAIGEGPETLLTAFLAEELFPKARHLIVELVLVSAASWGLKFAFKTNSCHLSWLHHVKSASVGETLQRRSWGSLCAACTAGLLEFPKKCSGPLAIETPRRWRQTCICCEHCESPPARPSGTQVVVCRVYLSTFHCEGAVDAGKACWRSLAWIQSIVRCVRPTHEI